MPYTVEDQMGHGSHTASLAAGDLRMASLSGYTTTIAGVAPHANLVVYRVCSPDPAIGCSYSAIVAAIDQAIADGIVDALNFSIGVVGNPWYDSVALAFLSAVDAGIFVAAAGGNVTSTTSQVPRTVINYEPWVTTVASSFHSGGALVQGATSTYRAAALGDELSPTSLLGPAPIDVIKPDMQAPGVDILAATGNDGTAGGPALVGMGQGTSMSTAHMTGAGALLLGLHRDWAPLEVKSALMMTAKESGLTKANGTTPSDFFDRGSGRLQEFVARNSVWVERPARA
jgi:subtilisin family serine protease